MKKFTLFFLMVLGSSLWVTAQKTSTPNAVARKTILSPMNTFTEFTDNFESGISKWTTTSFWGLSTVKAYSPTHSLSESPTGNYTNNQASTCTMATGVDLSARMSAEVSFYAQYQIEASFDYMYVDASNDNFATFTNLAVYSGVLNAWTQFTYSLGGFVGPGNTNVKVRFRFVSDQGYVMDGMYIDDFLITSSDEDHSPPLVLTTPPEFYEGNLGNFVVEADIIDISGLSVARCDYTVDGVPESSVTGVNTGGNHYTFTIPAQSAGANVQYVLTAVDNSQFANTISTLPAYYISGEYYKYDNAQVDYFVSFLAGTGASVVFTLNGPTHLATALIRNYTDNGHNNSPMLFHIWAPGTSGPGNDLITPFPVTAEATLTNTSPMTRIDLRPLMAQTGDLSGDVFIGFTVDADTVNLTETSPGTGGRSLAFNGTAWTVQTADYHFRLITTGSEVGLPEYTGNRLKLFPNPMNQYAFIQLGSAIQNPYVEVYTLIGEKVNMRQVIAGNSIQLLRDNLSSGMYVVKLYGDHKLLSQQKLIIR